MAKQILTQKIVDGFKCSKEDGKLLRLYDQGCRGLMLEARISGGKTYYFCHKDEYGKDKSFKIANEKDLTLAQARQMADKYRMKIAMGEKPKEERSILYQIPTFQEFAQQRYLPFAQSYKRSWKSDEGYLKNHLLPAFGKKRLHDIKQEDLISLMAKHKLNHKPSSTNKLIILMRYMYNLALKWKIPGITYNPTKDVKMLEEYGARERYLTKAETYRLMEQIKQSHNPMLQYIIPMLILTGARKSEVLRAKWKDINYEKKLWYIEFTKSGKPRYVPLNDSTLELLESIPRYKESAYIFPNTNNMEPYTCIFRTWDRARSAAGLKDVRIHDLRHSFASFLINAGRSLYEVQKLLGHSQIRTTQRYAHLAPETLLEATNSINKIIPFVVNKKKGA